MLHKCEQLGDFWSAWGPEYRVVPRTWLPRCKGGKGILVLSTSASVILRLALSCAEQRGGGGVESETRMSEG